ncbi:hypothetical protein SAMN02982989_4242 [Xaviernesmea oryzae]|uniref:Uncharacterized protein n=1 Tax=Xaviernesmea oryzae TaxID=464029 RepID=A0A1X7GRG4_9HYPH|nr:hypothetical protein [Xaviernesmea oryzae]SMF73109.1 hypothetical protein SAMN02982989_4242 [Xaviernesmea oryzae]
MTKLSVKAAGALFATASLMAAFLPVEDAAAQAPSPQKCAAPAEPENRQQEAPETGDRNLSKKLDDCNGVLKAPGVGDSEMVEPAPDTGRSRVIQPDTLPPDANPSNGSGG